MFSHFFHFRETLIHRIMPVVALALVFIIAITPVFAEDIPPEDTPVISETTTPASETPAAETAPASETPAVVTTGDATAVSTTESQANTNTTETEPATSEVQAPETAPSTEETASEASSTPLVSSENDTLSENASTTPLSLLDSATDNASTTPMGDNASTTPEVSGTASTTVESTNEGEVLNAAATGATTGGNSAAGAGGGSITTGDATAVSNTVTVLNSNIFNSEGFFMFLVALGLFGDLDLTHSVASSTLPTACGTGCSSEMTSLSAVSNTNTATIVNDVIVRSSTGDNSAQGNGTSTIQTGDAYAAANVVNVANTNIIDSNYLLLVFNNFGDWAGNLILPNKDFFENFFFKNQGKATSTGGSSSVSISNENQASVGNNVTTVADTGGNTASTTGESSIVTGNSSAGSSVSNILNTNIFGGSNFRILLRIHGDWTGNITGLPNGISWMETPNGIELIGSGSSSAGAATSTGNTGTSTAVVNNSNSASIQNNVGVYALTGDNKINGSGGSIQTGSAYAAANVLNMANTNVIGQNWLTIILNIFGNWSGSIAFGQPDLWIGTRAESVQGTFGPNTQVRYHYTIANRGTAPATNVILTNNFVSPFVSFNLATEQPFTTEWNLGTIAPQTSIDVTYTAVINDGIPHGQLEIPSTATLVSSESDANPIDNIDTISILTDRPFPTTETNRPILLTPDPVLTVTKTTSATSPITASTTVNYSVTVKNTGGPAYHAVLVDDLVDEKGNKLAEHSWELGTIESDEEIRVDYGVFFNARAKNGTYTNRVQVHAVGRHESMDPFYGWFADSNVAAAMITIENPVAVVPEPAPIAETLDVATSTISSVTTRSVPPPPVKIASTVLPPAPLSEPPLKTSFVFPSFQPFDFDSLSGNGATLLQGQAAAAILGTPAIDFPRQINIFLLVLAGIFIVQNQVPFKKIKNAFTTFMW